MSQLILVRHAQSVANRDQVSLGQHDSPVTDLGRRQIAALEGAFAHERVARVLSSPLARAREVAQAIGDVVGVPVETDPRLTEMDVGEMEGLAWPVARERFGSFLEAWLRDDASTLAMPGGESLEHVQARAWPVVESVLSADPDTDGGATVVVTHNFVVRALICRALGLALSHWRMFEVDLGSKTALTRVRGRVVLAYMNDTCHLAPDLFA